MSSSEPWRSKIAKAEDCFAGIPAQQSKRKSLVLRVLSSAFLVFVAYGFLLDYGATRYILEGHELLSEEHRLPAVSEETVSVRETNSVPKQEQDRGLVPEKVHVSLYDDDESKQSAGADDVRNTTLCFVTCIFGATVKHADSPRNVTGIFLNYTSPFDFLLFTNFEDLPAPGLTRLSRRIFRTSELLRKVDGPNSWGGARNSGDFVDELLVDW
jgi:hypothetical protein